MTFSQQLEVVKALIESTSASPKVEIFNGVFGDDVLKSIKIDGKRPHIMIGCGGGPVVQGSHRLEVDAVFIAIIIAKIDKNDPGNSKIAMDSACEIAMKVSKYRGDVKSNTKLPVVQSIEELSSGLTNGQGYSVLAVDWVQRVALD